MVGRQVVVQVEAAEEDEEDLAAGTQLAARGDGLRDLRQIAGDGVAARDRRGQRDARQGRAELLVGADGIAGGVGVGLLEEAAVLLAELAVDGLGALGRQVVDRRGVVAGQGRGAAGADAVGERLLAGQEDVLARQGDVHRHEARGVERREDVGRAPAPADGGALVGDAGLPLLDLVDVRKKRDRQRLTRLILAQRERADERADVGDEAEFAQVEQVAQFRHGRVQPERAAAQVGGGQRQQSVHGLREVAAGLGVGGILAAGGRHEHVERVVAAG